MAGFAIGWGKGDDTMIGMEDRVERSRRLTYRLIADCDREPLRAMLTDPKVTEPAGFRPPVTDEAFEEFFSGLTAYHTGVAILLGQELIGYVHVNKMNMDQGVYAGKSCLGLGFVLGRQYHRQGYATEMLNWITGYLKGRADWCFADAFVDNAPSNALIQRCGYTYVEDYSMYFDALGKTMTCHSYAYKL